MAMTLQEYQAAMDSGKLPSITGTADNISNISLGGPSAGYTGAIGTLPGFGGLTSTGSVGAYGGIGSGLPAGMSWEEYQNSAASIPTGDLQRYRTIDGKSVSDFGSMREYETALSAFMEKPAVQPDAALQQSNPELFKTLTDEYNDKTNPLIGTNDFEDATAQSGLRYSQFDSPEAYQNELAGYTERREAAKAESGDDPIWDRLKYPVIAGAAMFGGQALAGLGASGAGGTVASTGTAAGTGTVAGAIEAGTGLAATGAGAGTVAGTGTSAVGIGSGLSVGTGGTTATGIGSGLSVGGSAMPGATVAGGASSSGYGLTALKLGGKLALGALTSGGGGVGTDPAGTQASYEQQALDYLKERDVLPRKFSEGALSQLAGAYGLEGGTGSQQQIIERAQASPIYQAMQTQGEEAILRNASATGGLRSGNVQANLAKYNQQLLGDAYQQQLQGLSGMAQTPGYGAQIPGAMTDIGSTLAGGQLAEQRRAEAEKAQNIQYGIAAYNELGGMKGISEGISSGYDWLTSPSI